MKRLLVLGGAAVAALLALRHPAPPPALASVNPPGAQPLSSQHSRKGHPPAKSAVSVVYVAGAVVHPGLYRLQAGARVNDAVERAGGMRADADPAAVNLAERVSDGEEIRVLRLGEGVPKVRRSKRKTAARTFAAPSDMPIDLNAADAHALASIPGIGPTLASRIVAYRRLNGPFASLDELADVAGMTQRRIDAMAAYATINASP